VSTFSFFYPGCSASIYKFWCWHVGSWSKWYSEALEVATQWTKSKWKGNMWLKYIDINMFSFFCQWMDFWSRLVFKKATASVVPQHWQPNSGLLMTNDVSGVNLEEAVPCIALSKNDSYVMSATGGKVSLFNMMTFKVCLHMHVLQI